MKAGRERMRQLLDWRATVWAGLTGGVVSLILSILLSQAQLGAPWVFIRMIASIVMGEQVMQLPVEFDLTILAVGILVHLVISMVLAVIITTVLHRWGLIIGLIGGALFGLAFYAINFYLLSYFFPWFYPLRNWMILYAHIAFGALVGGVYEMLEVEEFVPVEE